MSKTFLEVVPGSSVGPFYIGMEVAEAMNICSSLGCVDFLFDRKNPFTTDIILREPAFGLTLCFDGHLQRLHLITVDVAVVSGGEQLPDMSSGCTRTGINDALDEDMEVSIQNPLIQSGAAYTVKGQTFCTRGHLSHFRQIYSLFGPTVPGEFSVPTSQVYKYFLNYLGCTFEVPLTPEQHSSFSHQGELPPESLENDSTAILIVSKFHIYPRQVKNFTSHITLTPANASSPHPSMSRLPIFYSLNRRFAPFLPPNPQSLPYGQNRLRVLVGIGFVAPSGALLRFGCSMQRILSVLGPCESACLKDVGFHPSGSNEMNNSNTNGMFLRYPTLGIDLLIDSFKRTLLKVVLHVNLPAHENFGISKRAFFDVLGNANYLLSAEGETTLARTLEVGGGSAGQKTHDATFMKGLAYHIITHGMNNMNNNNNNNTQNNHTSANQQQYQQQISSPPGLFGADRENSSRIAPIAMGDGEPFAVATENLAPPRIVMVDACHAMAKKKKAAATSVRSSLFSFLPTPTPTPSAPAVMLMQQEHPDLSFEPDELPQSPEENNTKHDDSSEDQLASGEHEQTTPLENNHRSNNERVEQVVEVANVLGTVVLSMPEAVKLPTKETDESLETRGDAFLSPQPSLLNSDDQPFFKPCDEFASKNFLHISNNSMNRSLNIDLSHSINLSPTTTTTNNNNNNTTSANNKLTPSNGNSPVLLPQAKPSTSPEHVLSPSKPLLLLDTASSSAMPPPRLLPVGPFNHAVNFQTSPQPHSSLPSSPPYLTPQPSLTHSPPGGPHPPPSPPPFANFMTLPEPQTLILPPPIPNARLLPSDSVMAILSPLKAIPIFNETTTWSLISNLIADIPLSSSESSSSYNTSAPPSASHNELGFSSASTMNNNSRSRMANELSCQGVPLVPLVLRKEASRAPWGSSRLYAIPGMAFEIVPSDHIAAITLSPCSDLIPSILSVNV
eukprot:GDKK01004736.1.p1 GENE.GDKK01004736.1~~GDKK01004736.1.p1  ORF type:complete len:965 (+),score=263.58 GDKK01004736.1:32-2896(+)